MLGAGNSVLFGPVQCESFPSNMAIGLVLFHSFILGHCYHMILAWKTGLFGPAHLQRTVPDQWLVAKTIPVFKNKGEAHKMENYRPIANVWSTSKSLKN